jgi:hypothetical protein
VVILLNLSPSIPVDARIDMTSCGALASRESFTLYRGAHGIEPGSTTAGGSSTVEQFLAPYSITLLDVHLAAPMAGTVAK